MVLPCCTALRFKRYSLYCATIQAALTSLTALPGVGGGSRDQRRPSSGRPRKACAAAERASTWAYPRATCPLPPPPTPLSPRARTQCARMHGGDAAVRPCVGVRVSDLRD
eukprot:3262245-Rhodomonas_salina.1